MAKNQIQNRPNPAPARRQAPAPAPKQQRSNDYDNTNTGVLFKNENKEHDKQPDMRGSFTDSNGNEYWLAAWSKVSKKGAKFLSIVATLKDDDSNHQRTEQVTDDLPF